METGDTVFSRGRGDVAEQMEESVECVARRKGGELGQHLDGSGSCVDTFIWKWESSRLVCRCRFRLRMG